MKLLIVGYGKMGRHGGRDGRRAGHRGGRDAWTTAATSGPPADVAVDFTTADALLANFPQYVEMRMPVVIGTTGWAEHAAELRRDAERAGLGVVASANFSIGVNMFQLVVAEAARLMRPPAAVRRVDPRAPPRRQARCAVGHGDPAARRDGGGGLRPSDRHVVEPGRAHPWHRIPSVSTARRIRSS